MHRVFYNRSDAGMALASHVAAVELKKPIILGLPRGGIPVASEVADVLGAPLDVLTVRKLGAPRQPELAIGAIASGGICVIGERHTIEALGVSDDDIAAIIARERRELERRDGEYRGDRPYPCARNRDVVLVDDGMATGSTMCAAIRAVREFGPARILVAVPTASVSAVAAVAPLVDELICLVKSSQFRAVGRYYDDFSQTTDGDVKDLLERSRRAQCP